MADKIPLEKLAADLEAATAVFKNLVFNYIPSGTKYRIIGLGYRRSDMKIEAHYTPLGEYFNRVVFHRELSEFTNTEKFEHMPENT